jgi:CHAT domain-containing protein
LAQSEFAKSRLASSQIRDQSAAEQQLVHDRKLATEIERLQAEISRRSAEFQLSVQPITLDAVQQALPAGHALVEVFSYVPGEWKTIKEDWPNSPRYIAYVVKDKGPIEFVEVGFTDSIDRVAKQFLNAISNPASVDAKEKGRALDEVVGRPIRKLLGGTHKVFISADGLLNLLPFAAFVDEQGKFLAEHYSISYLTSGRDLLRLNVARQSKQAPVVIANPTFDAATWNTAVLNGNGSQPKPDESRGRRSGNLGDTRWAELRGTAEEADSLRKLLPNARVLTGKDATEGALKQLSAPLILHLSTHGFFLPNEVSDRENPKFWKALEEHNYSFKALEKTARENPLLRSGIVLAGANTLQGGGNEDGILTALEAAGLNLWGTKLVVLSACETGVGDARSGEGVYGLRRALVLAGTESQVMTLWKVDDTATSEFVIEYYRRLQAGEERGDALRQIQLEFLQRKTRQHPFFWSSFILNGDWRSLQHRERR